MTMQTFVILFLGITLGSKIGLFTVSIYLLEGIYGIPVFAGTPEKGVGLIYFTGPTMGYLLGFLLTVYFAGLFKYEKGLINTFIKLVFSVSFIYFLGIMWLGILIGWEKPLFKLGAQPFLLAELFKILLLLFLIPSLLKIKKIIKII
jgi:biotin transport system substrate-specific component